MAQPSHRIFAFDPPSWRPPTRINLRTAMLLAGTILWLLFYGWLGGQLLITAWNLQEQKSQMALAALVVSGVTLVVGWRRLLPHWRTRLLDRFNRSGYRALTLKQLKALSPSEFESYVAERIFARQGYHVENRPDTKDGGVDILVIDQAGDLAVVQCKRYSGTVGAATVRDLYGTMAHQKAVQGYLVTTGRISNDARAWAAGKRIGLIDGKRLMVIARAEPHPHDTDFLIHTSDSSQSV